MSLAYINLGSNLGDRIKHISEAVERISETFGVCCISSIIESEPWGFESENRFLNLGVSFHTSLSPEALLCYLKRIEKDLSNVAHRDSSGNYKDREIDIDIMAIDEMTFDSETLQIPHPRLMEREFFLIPLKELNPSWRYPSEE